MKKHNCICNLFKNKDFFKILQTNDDLDYLAKSVEQLFSKPHLDASESASFFSDVTKVKNFDKKCLALSKKNFHFSRSK
jgi:hypothetical protein